MRQTKSVFFSAILGNILEYYDFTVYSVFTLTIGRTFFPAESESIQILSSLAVFAVGFLTRPIGGIFFGHVGDKYGRRISLIIAMLGMAIPTFIIGLIPSYDHIGIYAPIILIIMRLIQGLSVSGEGTGVAIFILEHHQNLQPGFTAGLVNGSNIVGTLFASLVGIIIEQYFYSVEFAWRFAFLLGGIIGFIGFYLRIIGEETPIFKMLLEKKKTLKVPFFNVIKTAWPAMFLTVCVGGIASSIVYLIKAYINIHYNTILQYDNKTALLALSYTSFILMISMPLFGGIADIFGKLKTVVLINLMAIILTLPSMLLMSLTGIWPQIIGLTILGIIGGAVAGPAYVFVISLFTPEQKLSGVAFSYNLGIAVFGGTTPVIACWLVEKTGLTYAPAFYTIAISSVFLMIIYLMRNIIKQLFQENT